MSAPPPPPMSREDRASAGQRGVRARQRRAEVKADVREGRLSLPDVIELASDDEDLARLRVLELLESLRGVGPARARALLEHAGISQTRRVRGLGVRQRVALLRAVSERHADRAALVVVSGPSGVGKSTVVRRVTERDPRVWVSVSVTTRPPRPGEVDGVSYVFASGAEFDRMVAAGELLEWAEFAGNRYGTPASPVEERRRAGVPVILEIELQGARQVRSAVPDATLVFLAPPSWSELVSRLVGRGTESPEVVERRLAAARVELDAEGEFDHTVVNTSVEAAAKALLDLLHPVRP